MHDHPVETIIPPALEPFVRQKTALLTTYRRNGASVGTPVHIAVAGDHAFFRTWDSAGKMKRIRTTPVVELAPSTVRGEPTGPAIHARARILAGDEAQQAGWVIAHKYPILHGVVIPLFHRLRQYRTMQIELTPTDAAQQPR